MSNLRRDRAFPEAPDASVVDVKPTENANARVGSLGPWISLQRAMPRPSGEPTESFEHTVREQAGHISALRARIDFLERRERELATELASARAELSRRADQERVADEENVRRIIKLEEQLGEANRVIQMMQATRVWRIGATYWRGREAFSRIRRDR